VIRPILTPAETAMLQAATAGDADAHTIRELVRLARRLAGDLDETTVRLDEVINAAGALMLATPTTERSAVAFGRVLAVARAMGCAPYKKS
jgi:hypothetical protein